jgi:hypothetical protein
VRKRLAPRQSGGLSSLTLGVSQLLRSFPIPVPRQLLNGVDQTVQFPLPIDLCSTTQRKAVQPFVVTEIAEDGFRARERGSAHTRSCAP